MEPVSKRECLEKVSREKTLAGPSELCLPGDFTHCDKQQLYFLPALGQPWRGCPRLPVPDSHQPFLSFLWRLLFLVFFPFLLIDNKADLTWLSVCLFFNYFISKYQKVSSFYMDPSHWVRLLYWCVINKRLFYIWRSRLPSVSACHIFWISSPFPESFFWHFWLFFPQFSSLHPLDTHPLSDSIFACFFFFFPSLQLSWQAY